MDIGNYQLANLFASARIRFGAKGGLSLTYNEYRAIKRYESMEYNLNHELQKAFSIAANIRPNRKMRICGRLDSRTRERDSKTASLALIGMRY